MTSENDKPTPGLGPDFLQAIGLVATNWSTLEMFVEEAIAGLLEVNTRGHIYALTANLQISTRLDAVVALAGMRLEPKNDLLELKRLVKQIDDLRPRRNRVIHAVWETTPDPAVAITHYMRSYRKLISRRDLIEVAEIERIAADIEATALEFNAFLREFGLL